MGILDLVFPKTCLGCGNVGKYLCQECMEKAKMAKPLCPYCRHLSIGGATHKTCRREFGIDGVISIWGYDGVVRKAILALKYKYATEIGIEMSEYAVCSLKSIIIPKVHNLTPIPIHWRKENTRGFNQSIELGGKLAVNMRLNFIPNLLIKKNSTVSQTELSGEARRQNLKDSFLFNPDYVSGSILSVIIFDDVFTTGSTLFEAAKVLKKGGVKTVWGLTIAS